MKIVIDLVDGKVAGVYGDVDNVEVVIYEDLDSKILTDEQEDALEIEVATVPFVLYQRPRQSCNNGECDFCCDGKCLYGGTAEVLPNPKHEGACKAFEPYSLEET